jgi:threonine/homoserine/homoserine lactone efflux protein
MVAQVIGFSAEPSAIGIAAVLLLILLVVLWFVVASAAALKGDVVENPNRMAQLYGYTVCLVAVILAITSLSSIVEAVFERAHTRRSSPTAKPR